MKSSSRFCTVRCSWRQRIFVENARARGACGGGPTSQAGGRSKRFVEAFEERGQKGICFFYRADTLAPQGFDQAVPAEPHCTAPTRPFACGE